MKRLISGVVILLISIVVGIYFFIPATLSIAASEKVGLNSETAFRFLNNKQHWYNWTDSNSFVPATGTLVHSAYKANGQQFNIDEVQYNAFKTSVNAEGETSNGRLSILPFSSDSVALQWQFSMPAGSNPLTRVKRYAAAAAIKASIVKQLGAMAAFLNNPVKTYGYPFNVTSTRDTLLIALKSIHDTAPGTAAIYASVDALRTYAQQNGARQTAAPMVNMTTSGEHKTEMMVALPVDKFLPGSGQIAYRKLIPGNFLVAEVKGGHATVNNALALMHQYIIDKRKTSMAIPFQVLITDRSVESDTAKWVTKVYYPIIR